MTAIMTQNIVNNCCGDAKAHSSLVVVSIGVLAALHDLVGMVVGGHFLDVLAKRFLESYEKEHSKDATNCMSLLCHMYNFNVCSCVLYSQL
jgi:hypothetical protein